MLALVLSLWLGERVLSYSQIQDMCENYSQGSNTLAYFAEVSITKSK